MDMKILRPGDYVVSEKDGAEITQMAVFPGDSDPGAADYLWMVSCEKRGEADCELPLLADYTRWIAPLFGELELSHEGRERFKMKQYDIHSFDGDVATHFFSRSSNLCISLRRNFYEDSVVHLDMKKGETQSFADMDSWNTVLIYCCSGKTAVGGSTLKTDELAVISCDAPVLQIEAKKDSALIVCLLASAAQ